MRALLIAYAFPPVGGVGVARVLKLQKYLPDHGVDVEVMTVANPSVPLIDESLMSDLRPDTRVIRARSLEPGYAAKQAAWKSLSESPRPGGRLKRGISSLARHLLAPDPQVLWQPAAQWALLRRLAADPPLDVIFISGPPFSQFLLALLPRLRAKTTVILDYRDEWITYRKSYEMMGGLGRLVGGPLEWGLLRCAHAVTVATPAFRDNLLERFGFLSEKAVHTLPNGYDPDDFPPQLPDPSGEQMVLGYAGTVFSMNSPRALLQALKLLHQREPELGRRLRVEFIGRIVETENALFEGSESLGVVRHGFMPKREALLRLARSHMTLCTLSDVAGNERVYPAKIFDLMYLGRPCLTLAGPGVLTDLAHRHRLGPVLPWDVEAICAALTDALRRFCRGDWPARSEAVDVDRFHRRAQAGELARIFSSATRART